MRTTVIPGATSPWLFTVAPFRGRGKGEGFRDDRHSRGNEPLAIHLGPGRGRGMGEGLRTTVIPGATSPWLFSTAPFRGQLQSKWAPPTGRVWSCRHHPPWPPFARGANKVGGVRILGAPRGRVWSCRHHPPWPPFARGANRVGGVRMCGERRCGSVGGGVQREYHREVACGLAATTPRGPPSQGGQTKWGAFACAGRFIYVPLHHHVRPGLGRRPRGLGRAPGRVPARAPGAGEGRIGCLGPARSLR